jgi:hypothetical protein
VNSQVAEQTKAGNSTASNRLAPRDVLRLLIVTAILLGSVLLLFGHLGHYALWTDEADTALTAKAIWRTGDSWAMIDQNILAYGGGREIRDFRLRFMPPLPGYLVAPFIGFLGETSFAARLPFALSGLACVALFITWLGKAKASVRIWAITAVALLSNVSFFLFFRQCRYYGIAMLTSAAIAYCYVFWDGRRGFLALMGVLSICLLASNYLNYFALYVCLAVDYSFWGRKRTVFNLNELALLVIPQVLVGALLFWIWNPLHFAPGIRGGVLDRFVVIWWNFRDMFRAEFAITALVLAAPLLAFWLPTGCRPWLWRAIVALALYPVAIAIISLETTLADYHFANVRYLAPLIPLGIAVAILAIHAIWEKSRLAACVVAVLGFGTNILHGGFVYPEGTRCTIAKFIAELIWPPLEPYSIASSWVGKHVAPGRSVLVLPKQMTYPLMFHASSATYAWQIAYPPCKELAGLPPIHFSGVIPPEYIIIFGRNLAAKEEASRLEQFANLYHPAAHFDIYGRDMFRPELFLRTFDGIEDFDHQREGITIYKKTL